MKKVFLMLIMVMFTTIAVKADKKGAQIKFDKTTYQFADFDENDAIQSCVFTFTNVGDEPLVINRAVASCGCTEPSYTKKPVLPGQKGEVKVTYNGTGKFPGHFKKTITIETNGIPERTRLYIEGNMTEHKK